MARTWVRERTRLLAPPLFRAEVTSVIRERVYRGEMQADDAGAALIGSFGWPIAIRDLGDSLQRRAFDIATQFNRPKAYDGQYLALAELLGCELWTGDRRLINVVAGKLPWLHWIGDYKPA